MPRVKKKKARPKPSRNLECGGLAAAFEPAALSRTSLCSQPITVRVRSRTANRGFAPSPNLINRRRLRRRNTNESPVSPLVLKLHDPSHQRVKRIVFTLPDIHASLMLSPTLPNQNRPRINQLPAKTFHTQPLPVRIAPVS